MVGRHPVTTPTRHIICDSSQQKTSSRYRGVANIVIVINTVDSLMMMLYWLTCDSIAKSRSVMVTADTIALMLLHSKPLRGCANHLVLCSRSSATERAAVSIWSNHYASIGSRLGFRSLGLLWTNTGYCCTFRELRVAIICWTLANMMLLTLVRRWNNLSEPIIKGRLLLRILTYIACY